MRSNQEIQEAFLEVAGSIFTTAVIFAAVFMFF